MKNILKRHSILIALVLVVVAFLSAVVVPFGVNTKTVKAQEEEGVSFETSWCSLDYYDGEVVLLLSSSISDYKSFSKSDISGLVSTIIDIATKTITEKMSNKTFSSNNPLMVKSGLMTFGTLAPSYEIDISLLSKVITSQLGDSKYELDSALDDGKYDSLIQYYADKKIYQYATEEGLESSEIEYVKNNFKEQLQTIIVDVVADIYKDYEPELVAQMQQQASAKMGDLISDPNLKGDGESISLPLADITRFAYELPSVAEETGASLVDIVKDLKVANKEDDKLVADIKETVKNSDTQEIKDFFAGTKDGDLLDIVKAVEFDSEDVKEMAKKIGGEALLDIMSDLGDKTKDLLDACDVSTEDLKEIVSDPSFNIDVTSLIKAVELITINGKTIYSEKKFSVSGLLDVIKELPKLKDIANFTDEEMRFSFDIYAKTSLGSGSVKLTVGLYGDSSKIRKIAKIISDNISIEKQDGVYNISVNVPQIFANGIKKLLNSNDIPKYFKDLFFDFTNKTIDELYQQVANTQFFEEAIEQLKQIDYNKIAENIYSAEQISKIFGEFVDLSNLTEDKLDGLVNKFMDLAKKIKGKVSGITYDGVIDQIKGFVGKIVGEDKINQLKEVGKLESLYNKVITLLNKVDDEKLSAEYIRNCINDGKVTYLVNRVLTKILSYENYFEKFLSYVEKLYNSVPNKVKNASLLNIYEGIGSFQFDVATELDLQDILDKIYNVLDGKLPSSLDSFVDNLYSKAGNIIDALIADDTYHLAINAKAKVNGLNKITFMVDGEVVKEGLLPSGTKLSEFSPYASYVWELDDQSVCEYMPDSDTIVYAISNFTLTTSEDVTMDYDGVGADISVSIKASDTLETYTYQWYKDGEIIDGATENSYHVVNVLDSGEYYCKVTSSKCFESSDVITVAISKVKLDVTLTCSDEDNTIEFGDEAPTYSIDSYSGFIGSDSESVVSGTKIIASSYVVNDLPASYGIATVGTEILDSDNYYFNFIYDDLVVTKKTIGVSWDTSNLIYTGSELKPIATATNTISGFDCTLSSTGAINAGTGYTSVASILTGDTYYVLSSDETVYKTTFAIEKATYDMSGVSFDDASIVYDGEAHSLVVSGILPTGADGIKVSVAYSNSQQEVGTYSITATFSTTSTNYETPESMTASLTLSKKPVDIVVEMSSFTYGDQPSEPQVTVAGTIDNYKIEVSLMYIGYTKAGVQYESTEIPTDAGEYKVLAYFDEVNYKLGEISFANFVIFQKEIDLSSDWNYSGNLFYTSNEQEVKLNETNEDILSLLTITGNKATLVGKYTAKVVCNNINYYIIGINDLQWEIKKNDITLTWDYDYNITYSGDEVEIKLTETNLSILDLLLISGNKATDAGNYVAKVALKEEYKYSYSISIEDLNWTIKQKEIDLSSGWNYSQDISYTGSEIEIKLNETNEDVLSLLTITDNKATDVGEYTAKVVCNNANYFISNIEDLDWKIVKQVIDLVSYSWNYSQAIVYDGQEKTVVLDVAENDISSKLVYADNKATDVGTYTASVSPINDNYKLINVDELSWEISKADYDMAGVTFTDTEFVYDGEKHTLEVEGVLPTGADGITVKVEYSCYQINMNEYVYTAKFSTTSLNYNTPNPETLTATLTFKQRELNVTVYIDNFTYGETPSAPSVSVLGFANTEDEVLGTDSITFGNDSFDISYMFIGLTDAGENYSSSEVPSEAGIYQVYASFDALNYVLDGLQEATLVIYKQIIDLSSYSWNYTNPYTYNGVTRVVELNIYDFSINYLIEYTDNTAVDVGTYTADVVCIDANYELSGVSPCVWKINPIIINLLSLTWNCNNFEYDGLEKKVELTNVPAYMTVTYSGNIESDVGEYYATFDYTLASDNYIAVGTPTPFAWSIIDPKAGLANIFEKKDGDIVLVSVEAEYGIDENLQLLLEDLTSKFEDTDFSAIGEDYKLKLVYNILFLNEIGNHVDVSDKFTVKILIPEDIETRDVKVVYIAEDGKLVEVESQIEGDYMVFETTHFSNYAIVYNQSVDTMALLTYSLTTLVLIFAIVMVILNFSKKRRK